MIVAIDRYLGMSKDGLEMVENTVCNLFKIIARGAITMLNTNLLHCLVYIT
jgi:hypothetical protein